MPKTRPYGGFAGRIGGEDAKRRRQKLRSVRESVTLAGAFVASVQTHA